MPRLYESLVGQSCQDFIWMVIDDGSNDNTEELIKGYIAEKKIEIEYYYKENGGLFTGYNLAYEKIETELNVCIDSDDWMPPNAIELIIEKWEKEGSDKYCGIVGLDFYAENGKPIAGYFPPEMKECYYIDLYAKNIHRGDSKYVMRTDLMKEVTPESGFLGEKYFNPTYLFLKVCDNYPLLVLNRNLCFVGTSNTDRMSLNIYRQYLQSPRSFAKMRELEMGLRRCTFKNKLRSAVHYVAESFIAGDSSFFRKTSHKAAVFFSFIPGLFLYFFIKYKVRVTD